MCKGIPTSTELIRFYTGFDNCEILKGVFEALKPDDEKMIRWVQFQKGVQDVQSAFQDEKLHLFDQFSLFLNYLRLGLFELNLAERYDCSLSTVSRTLITCANFLYFLLGSQPICPSREILKEFQPSGFKELYPSVRVILDCTERKCQTPTALLLNSQMYSVYKDHTTFKALVGVTPYCAVSFLSILYTGYISDKEITKSSGILPLLEKGDEVMADKGFTISQLLSEQMVKLVIPLFLTSERSQFEEVEVQDTEQIARLRIHVERTIRSIEEKHLFDRVLPLSLAGTINQRWTASCLLTDFKGPLF